MSFSRYIPFEGCDGPERTESLWRGLVYCALLPAVVRSLADEGATRVVTILWADLAMVSVLAFFALEGPAGSSDLTSAFTFVYFSPCNNLYTSFFITSKWWAVSWRGSSLMSSLFCLYKLTSLSAAAKATLK